VLAGACGGKAIVGGAGIAVVAVDRERRVWHAAALGTLQRPSALV
jgi:hypothetical protein